MIRAAGLKGDNKKKGKIGKYIILAGLILFCIALARPQLLDQSLPLKREGIDIALVLDVSGSMDRWISGRGAWRLPGRPWTNSSSRGIRTVFPWSSLPEQPIPGFPDP